MSAENKLITDLTAHQDLYLAYENSDEKLTWCSGCGNYSIQKALLRALALEGYEQDQVLICYDIGCSGNGSDKIGAYTIHGLHGRILPLAAGAALANQHLKVVAIAGDGATFSEGVNHLVHSVRSNYPITFVFHNNENYGLTTGQASAATRKGQKMNGSPDGVLLDPLNACQFALTLHPTFVARAFSGNTEHTTEILRQALRHDGFSFVEILQLCPTYNKATSQNWFLDRVQDIEHTPEYDRHDLWAARKKVEDLEEKIAIGVLYEREDTNFYQKMPQRTVLKTAATEEVRPYDISALMQEFA